VVLKPELLFVLNSGTWLLVSNLPSEKQDSLLYFFLKKKIVFVPKRVSWNCLVSVFAHSLALSFSGSVERSCDFANQVPTFVQVGEQK
jgi:hypothetical protein